MNPIEAALRRIAADLAASERRWAIIGGLAVSARAEPRTTRDVDLAVAVADDQDAEGLVFELQSRGYRVLAAVEQTGVGRLSTTRLSTPGAGPKGVVVDLLFASSGIEPEVAGITAGGRWSSTWSKSFASAGNRDDITRCVAVREAETVDGAGRRTASHPDAVDPSWRRAPVEQQCSTLHAPPHSFRVA
jgi:hypothetical protein